MSSLPRPKLEGSVAVRDGRRLSFAEYGDPHGPAYIWMHGTPGGRRQVAPALRNYVREQGLRLICIDRPGIGTSTPHLADDLIDWCQDLDVFLDNLGISTIRVAGLSGGGPYALAAGVALGDRVESIGVLGGVAPVVGPDAITGGLITLARLAGPALPLLRLPVGFALAQAIQLVRAAGGPILDAYAYFQPDGDKRLLKEPEFKEMFLDDLINASRFQVSAPITDLVLFTRDWGFTLDQVQQHVTWWHGNEDPIVPLAHGEHAAARLPDCTFHEVDGGAHLGGLEIAVEVVQALTKQDA